VAMTVDILDVPALDVIPSERMPRRAEGWGRATTLGVGQPFGCSPRPPTRHCTLCHRGWASPRVPLGL
jgi:hypothetical protein